MDPDAQARTILLERDTSSSDRNDGDDQKFSQLFSDEVEALEHTIEQFSYLLEDDDEGDKKETQVSIDALVMSMESTSSSESETLAFTMSGTGSYQGNFCFVSIGDSDCYTASQSFSSTFDEEELKEADETAFEGSLHDDSSSYDSLSIRYSEEDGEYFLCNIEQDIWDDTDYELDYTLHSDISSSDSSEDGSTKIVQRERKEKELINKEFVEVVSSCHGGPVTDSFEVVTNESSKACGIVVLQDRDQKKEYTVDEVETPPNQADQLDRSISLESFANSSGQKEVPEEILQEEHMVSTEETDANTLTPQTEQKTESLQSHKHTSFTIPSQQKEECRSKCPSVGTQQTFPSLLERFVSMLFSDGEVEKGPEGHLNKPAPIIICNDNESEVTTEKPLLEPRSATEVEPNVLDSRLESNAINRDDTEGLEHALEIENRDIDPSPVTSATQDIVEADSQSLLLICKVSFDSLSSTLSHEVDVLMHSLSDSIELLPRTRKFIFGDSCEDNGELSGMFPVSLPSTMTWVKREKSMHSQMKALVCTE